MKGISQNAILTCGLFLLIFFSKLYCSIFCQHTFLPSVPYIRVTQNFVTDDLIGCYI